jgi:hypothetical protein
VQCSSSGGAYYYYAGNFVAIKNSSGELVPPTEEGKREFYIHERADDGKISGYSFGYGNIKPRLALAPKTALQISYPCPINKYFQMDKPDTYEITFYRKSFFSSQLYAQPVPSNTLKIKVVESEGKSIQ